MTKFLVVAGDSFSSDTEGWPRHLANRLGLELVSCGIAGAHWWEIKDFLKNLSEFVVKNTEVIVVVHTFFDRIPSRIPSFRTLNIHDNSDNSELTQAARLYYKFINNSEFMLWAQQMWFKELSDQWSHTKLINLHGFPWSLGHLLPSGINMTPSLASLSLNEIDSKDGSLFADERPNHFNEFNNTEIANQLEQLVIRYSPGLKKFDVGRFEQKTNKWENWK